MNSTDLPGLSAIDASDLATVTVTYFPDVDTLARQLRSIPGELLKVIVDNGSDSASLTAVQRLAADIQRTRVIVNVCNLGLPAALNAGVRKVMEDVPACRHVLFLDQDTEPESGAVQSLLWWSRHLEKAEHPVGAVGPALVDIQTGLKHGFHRIAGWRWSRLFPSPDSAPVECDTLNCSGMLVSTAAFSELGGLDESLFMDHVDTEWSFRLRAAGYRLYGAPDAIFLHRMGQSTWRLWLGGWKIWPYRPPSRHFFLFRNAVWLMRRRYVPPVWKAWAVLKLVVTAAIHLAFDKHRWQQISSMARGVLAGIRTAGK